MSQETKKSFTSKKSEKTTKSNKKPLLSKSKTDNLDLIRSEVSGMSYEDSFEALDSILRALQNNDAALDQLKKHYIKGSIYLEHCEQLLDNFEQEIKELNLESLNNLTELSSN